MKRFSLALVAVLLVFTSCKKDETDSDPEPEKETTVQEDKENIEKSLDEIVKCADEIKTGRVVSLVQDVFEINKGEGEEQEWLLEMFDSLPSVFDFEAIEANERLDISDHSSKYSFNSSTDKWVKSSAASGTIILEFPSAKGGQNDLVLTVSGYEDKSLNFDGDDISLPTKLYMNFSQGNNTLLELDLKSVQYEELTTVTIPVYIEAEIIIAPLRASLVARKVNNELFDVNLDITNDQSCNMKFFAELKLNNDDYENLDEDDFDYVKGSFTSNQLKLTSDVDLNTLLSIEDPTVGQLNSLFDVDVYYEDSKIGDLEANADQEIVEIVYKDGTKDNVEEVYLVPFLEDLELTLFDLVGDWEI